MPVPRTDTRPTSQQQGVGDVRAHGIAVGRDLRLLQHDERVDVDDAPAHARDAAPGLGEQVEAARAGPALVARREHRPDVVQAGGAEQRVAEGVADDVGVGVPLEAVGVRDLDAAEYERQARDEPVRVECRADAQLSQAVPRGARGR